MAQIPEPVNGIAQAIDRAYEVEAQSEPLRPHLGASIIGHECDRYIWLSFRWAFRPKFPGRVLRLFDRGQREEARVIAWLERIGVVMRPMDGQQERVSFGWHFGGSIDGIIESGLPEAPTKPHILEIKTHNKKSFDALASHGVGKSKPMHFDQMQVYMLGTGIDRALYFAVCKDDDRIYTERVRLEPDYAQRLVDLAKSIVQADRPPEPISADPTYYVCKMCDAYDLCHQTHLTKEANCRTCAHSTAKADDSWRCERHEADGIPLEYQRKGCGDHILHPDLVPWQMGQSGTREYAVYMIDGKPLKNGTGGEASQKLIDDFVPF